MRDVLGRFRHFPARSLQIGCMCTLLLGGCGKDGIVAPTVTPDANTEVATTPPDAQGTATPDLGLNDTNVPTPTPSEPPTPTASPSDTPGTPTATPTPTRIPGIDGDRDGWTVEAGDCDDNNDEIYPGAVEVCDGEDNDCDKYIDDSDDDTADAVWYYPDNDQDRFGDPTKGIFSCKAVTGFILVGTDCNDGRADINPDAPELCDPYSIDEDCDGYSDDDDLSVSASSQDLWYPDRDLDGFGDANSNGALHCHDPSDGFYVWLTDHRDCNDADPWVRPSSTEKCDAQDTDCDGDVDEGFDGDGDGTSDCIDDDNDTFTEREGDCDDSDGEVFPFSPFRPDNDQDGWPDLCDNCIWVANEDQGDVDEDGKGDLCTVSEGEWSTPEPVAELNTISVNAFPFVSADGLHMYFVSHRTPSEGMGDIWTAHRKSRDLPFGDLESLGPPVNSEEHESMPTLTADGLTLYFARSTGEFEDSNIYTATRKDPLLPFDTPEAVEELNTKDFGESHPSISPDGLALYFSSDVSGTTDLYVARRSSRADIFSPATLVTPLSTEFGDRSFMLRSDGLRGYLTSSRSDGANSDLYEVEIGEDGTMQSPLSIKLLAHDSFDGGGSVTADGQELYYFSSREGEYQVWRSYLAKPEDTTPTPSSGTDVSPTQSHSSSPEEGTEETGGLSPTPAPPTVVQ